MKAETLTFGINLFQLSVVMYGFIPGTNAATSWKFRSMRWLAVQKTAAYSPWLNDPTTTAGVQLVMRLLAGTLTSAAETK